MTSKFAKGKLRKIHSREISVSLFCLAIRCKNLLIITRFLGNSRFLVEQQLVPTMNDELTMRTVEYRACTLNQLRHLLLRALLTKPSNWLALLKRPIGDRYLLPAFWRSAVFFNQVFFTRECGRFCKRWVSLQLYHLQLCPLDINHFSESQGKYTNCCFLSKEIYRFFCAILLYWKVRKVDCGFDMVAIFYNFRNHQAIKATHDA